MRYTFRYITAILFLSGLVACNNSSQDRKPITIEDRMYSQKTVLSPVFDSLRPAAQTFLIKGNRDTLIIGQSGTTLTIPKNTFITAQGEAATTVTLSLVEATTISDIIKLNLQTTSGENILQTGGMFFIDAKENGRSLAIAEGKSIYVEVKANYKDPQMKIFEGKFNNKGKIDWALTGDLENYLIPIPLSLLNFHKCDLECGFSKGQTDSLLSPIYENTFIATREFEDRCCVMSIAGCDWYNGLSKRLLTIYLSNLEKPLYYSDSLVVDYLAKSYKDKIDTSRKFQFDDTGWTTYLFRAFTQLKNQHLTNAINFNKLGITGSTSSEDMVAKGYSEAEAEKYIALFKVREQVIKERKTEIQTSRLASYSFAINKLGWVNVDRFIDEKNTEVSTFLVNVQSKDTLDFVSVSLVIPNYNVAVFSIYNDGNLYSFTKKKDGYRKLPVGQDAIVVAFSYKNNKPYFGKQAIKIPKDGQISLPIEPSTEKDIKQKIEKLTE
ncbi:hypothetical protein [Ferruginibacter albus]|uniref:hypothetical protein n=1 Tax=Ferruginibacter albus TaxID=2875540 RepID=UPI001CC398E0|nr:hypothetical protein [Ferruginibacter albus]UAY53045.1 hypothetical protein K9M53_05035 [Ferruginibacter albus]